jgi:cytochrome bd-type quinol oxidase subunit 2
LADGCLTDSVDSDDGDTPSFDLLVAFLSHPLGLASIAVATLGNVTKRRMVAMTCTVVLLLACLIAAGAAWLYGEQMRALFTTHCAGDPWLIVFLLFIFMNSVGFRVPKS